MLTEFQLLLVSDQTINAEGFPGGFHSSGTMLRGSWNLCHPWERVAKNMHVAESRALMADRWFHNLFLGHHSCSDSCCCWRNRYICFILCCPGHCRDPSPDKVGWLGCVWLDLWTTTPSRSQHCKGSTAREQAPSDGRFWWQGGLSWLGDTWI